jgi:hypothetical protein
MEIKKFTCPRDAKEFNAQWTVGAKVTCPYCEGIFPTDFKERGDPWIVTLVEPWRTPSSP